MAAKFLRGLKSMSRYINERWIRKGVLGRDSCFFIIA